MERFYDVKVRVTYQKVLQAEVLGLTESVSRRYESGMKGEPLVQCMSGKIISSKERGWRKDDCVW